MKKLIKSMICLLYIEIDMHRLSCVKFLLDKLESFKKSDLLLENINLKYCDYINYIVTGIFRKSFNFYDK